MNRRWIDRVPLLLAASVLLLGGAAEEEGAGQQMLAAGFVVLGAWVGAEARGLAAKRDDPPQEAVPEPSPRYIR